MRVRAYNASGDGAVSAESTATPTTATTLTASAVTAHGVTLTIANHTGDWYWKYTVPENGTCVSTAVQGAAAGVTELLGDTSYTFAAYGDSQCSTTPLATAPAVLTKPKQVGALTIARARGSST